MDGAGDERRRFGCAAQARVGGDNGSDAGDHGAGEPDARRKVLLGLLCELPGRTAPDSVRYREQQLGRQLAIDSHYYDWADTFPGAREAEDAAVGRIPMITWWGVSNSKVINGSEDGLIRTAPAAVKAFGRPVFLRWGAEMNGDWYAWSGAASGNDPAKYVAAYRHIHDLFTAAGATNARWVWAPNADSHPGGTSLTLLEQLAQLLPGGRLRRLGGHRRLQLGDRRRQRLAVTGEHLRPDLPRLRRPQADHARRDLLGRVRGQQGGVGVEPVGVGQDAPAVQALVWFDTNLSSTRLDWRIDSSSAALAAFKSLGTDTWFVRTSLP